MFFRRLNFNIFYISLYRFFYFILLFVFLALDLNSNLFICSFLKSFFITLNLKFLLSDLLLLVLLSLSIKFFITKKKNLINFILIDTYLLVSFLFKNISKYLTFLNTHFSSTLLYNLIYFLKNNIILNSKIYYIYTYIIKNIIKRNYSWFPLYKKISYYGYFRSSRFNNSQDYEKNIYSLKN